MKLSYSKMILSGIVATSFFMVSCQKKGSAHGVQPQSATTTEDGKDVLPLPDDKLPKDGGVTLRPPTTKSSDDTTVKPSTPSSADVTTVEAPKVKPETAPVVEKKPEAKPAVEKTIPPVTPAKSKTVGKLSTIDQPETLPEVIVVTKIKKSKTVATKKDSEKATPEDIKLCSEEVVNQAKKLSAQKSALEKKNRTTAETIKADKEMLVLCKEWHNLFTRLNLKSCEYTPEGADQKYVLSSNETYNEICYDTGIKLKILSGEDNEYSSALNKKTQQEATLSGSETKSKKLIVQDEAKVMFDKENKNWKSFFINGKIVSDEAKLKEALANNKVACSITHSSLENITENQILSIKIITVDKLIAENTTSLIQNGVDISIELKTESKDKIDLESTKEAAKTGIISCVNLKSDNLDKDALKAAFGKYITEVAQ